MRDEEENKEEYRKPEKVNKEGDIPAEYKQSSGDESRHHTCKSSGTALQADHFTSFFTFEKIDNQD